MYNADHVLDAVPTLYIAAWPAVHVQGKSTKIARIYNKEDECLSRNASGTLSGSKIESKPMKECRSH